MGKAYTVEEQHLYETYVIWKHNGHEMPTELARDLYRNPRILQCTCDRTVMVVEAMAEDGMLEGCRDPKQLLLKFAGRLAQAKLTKGTDPLLVKELGKVVKGLRREVHGTPA